jgi:hypothetical protein
VIVAAAVASIRPRARLRGRWAIGSIALLLLAGWHANGPRRRCAARGPALLVLVLPLERELPADGAPFASLSTLRSRAARRFSRSSIPRTRFCRSSTRSRVAAIARQALGPGTSFSRLHRVIAQASQLAEQIGLLTSAMRLQHT